MSTKYLSFLKLEFVVHTFCIADSGSVDYVLPSRRPVLYSDNRININGLEQLDQIDKIRRPLYDVT